MSESPSQSTNEDREARMDMDSTEEVIMLPHQHNPYPLSNFYYFSPPFFVSLTSFLIIPLFHLQFPLPLDEMEEFYLLGLDSPSARAGSIAGVTPIDWAEEMIGPTPPSPSHQPNHLHLPQPRQDAPPGPAQPFIPPPPPPPRDREGKDANAATTSEKRKRYRIPKVKSNFL